MELIHDEFCPLNFLSIIKRASKVHIFWEGHKFLWNLHCRFVLCSNGLKSRNSGDHKFWNHEMQGPPVYLYPTDIEEFLCELQ